MAQGTAHALREPDGVRWRVWFGWFNEVPVLLLTAIFVVVVVKPF